MNSNNFSHFIRQKGEELYRDMPWREDTRPYYVLVSELMLQQTQVSRVIPKFEAFITAFPDEETLAEASLAEVLKLWQGLGYNRRAKFLHESAKMITSELGGVFPNTVEGLQRLPGVGKNTAGAIIAYSFNQPVIYVETNIRTVYIHHFFNDQFDIDDKQIIEKMHETVPWKGKEQPETNFHTNSLGAMRKTAGLSHESRRFYWALMDYGAWLKNQGIKNIDLSKHYKKQSALKGSLREMRGILLRELSKNGDLSVYKKDVRFQNALDGLERDGLVEISDGKVELTK